MIFQTLSVGSVLPDGEAGPGVRRTEDHPGWLLLEKG